MPVTVMLHAADFPPSFAAGRCLMLPLHLEQASHAGLQHVPVSEQLWPGTLQKLVAVSFRLLSWRQGMQLSSAWQQLQARALVACLRSEV